ncbi:MAG: DUF3177 family protein [Cyanobacteria bacterium J06642_2]
MNISPELLELLVWWDFRLAVGLNVFVPLLLLAWAFQAQFPPLTSVAIAYWRVSSLLAVTVYLMIAAFPIGFLTGALARALIVMSLWYGPDAVVAVSSDNRLATRVFRGWRWLVTAYMGLGTLVSALFVPCAFQPELSPNCAVWLQPPLGFKAIFHPHVAAETLGLVGALGLLAYISVFALYLWQLNRVQPSDG